jgi:hypothetical protein
MAQGAVMGNSNPAGQATESAVLRAQIMDCRVPKNEREWWASRTIAQLTEALEWALNDMQGVTRYTGPEQWNNCMDRAEAALAAAQVGRNPEGQDPQGLGAEHEHAVGEADAPVTPCSPEQNQ